MYDWLLFMEQGGEDAGVEGEVVPGEDLRRH